MCLEKTNRVASSFRRVTGTIEPAPKRRHGWARLLLGVLAVAVTWLIVLPRMQRLPAVERHLRLLEEKQIDASALYYTDLEVMHDIYHRRQQP